MDQLDPNIWNLETNFRLTPTSISRTAHIINPVGSVSLTMAGTCVMRKIEHIVVKIPREKAKMRPYFRLLFNWSCKTRGMGRRNNIISHTMVVMEVP